MINEFVTIIGLILVNIVIIKFFIKISNKFKIYDKPDFSRKIHTSNIPLIGGMIFLLNILIYLPYYFLIMENNLIFNGTRETFAFYFGSIAIFFIGLYDDRFSLKPNTKLILVFLISLITVSLSNTFKINELNFLFLEKTIFLENFGTIFTIFCILVFLNAFNMIDGINGLGVSYFVICIIYLFILNQNVIFYLFLIIPALVFLYNNLKGKIFLGDNGSLLLAFILSCLFIKFYNEKSIYADQIVLLMIVPGIDMLRVAITRILKKKHPFEPDRSHIHHLLIKNYNPTISYLGIIFIVGLSAFLSIIIKNEYINIIQILIIIISYFIYFISKKSN